MRRLEKVGREKQELNKDETMEASPLWFADGRSQLSADFLGIRNKCDFKEVI